MSLEDLLTPDEKAFNDGMGVDINDPKFADRMLASQILLFLDGER